MTSAVFFNNKHNFRKTSDRLRLGRLQRDFRKTLGRLQEDFRKTHGRLTDDLRMTLG